MMKGGTAMTTVRSMEGDGLKERHILVAVDGSENSRRAVSFVADFFGGYPGFRVTLLHIVLEPAAGHFASEAERRAWVAEREVQAHDTLAGYCHLLAEGGVPDGQVDVLIEVTQAPSIADAILGAQEWLQGCTIVVGRRGLSKREEFLLGSTSNKILHGAKGCAVMVIE
jgi:nucleotide-binding universal stress UspA family protein